MKIVLICPSNKLYMPYVENYEQVLKRTKVDYSIICWDRFQIEDRNQQFVYRDSKIGHQRNYVDYLRYKQFVLKKLKENKYDKLIIFGVQLTYFLKSYLEKYYTGNFILDVRDHNKMIHFFNFKRVIEKSAFTVISSPGYLKWLPLSEKYVINHNSKLNSLKQTKEIVKFNNDFIDISFIGAIRDYDVNIELINSVKNSTNIRVYYHGEGDINKDIMEYLSQNKITNVYFSGRYNRENEGDLYAASNLINVLRYNDGINNSTALPNRLYNSAQFGKPMIALEGTYLAEIIKEYQLGLVLDSLDHVELKIYDYVTNFREENFRKGRFDFLQRTIEENKIFNSNLEKFLEKQMLQII